MNNAGEKSTFSKGLFLFLYPLSSNDMSQNQDITEGDLEYSFGKLWLPSKQTLKILTS